MSAESEMHGQIVRLEQLTKTAFVNVVQETLRSIVEGSEITAAPGQPVDTGALRASWTVDFASDTSATIGTNLDYAEAVEEGIGPHGPVVYGKSGVGGSHSVALTIAGMPQIVNVVTGQVLGGLDRFNNGAAGWSGEDGG